jgi:hypothetical protein
LLVAASREMEVTRQPPRQERLGVLSRRLSARGAMREEATVPFAIQRTSNASWCASA